MTYGDVAKAKVTTDCTALPQPKDERQKGRTDPQITLMRADYEEGGERGRDRGPPSAPQA